MNSQEMNGTFTRAMIQRLRHLNLNYSRVFYFFLAAAGTILITWLALAPSVFSIGEDSILYGNKNSSSFFLLEIMNPSMINDNDAAFYIFLGFVSLLIWELRVDRYKMANSTRHRLFRLAIVCAIIGLSIWNNGTLY